jgi:hypothetical protein
MHVFSYDGMINMLLMLDGIRKRIGLGHMF